MIEFDAEWLRFPLATRDDYGAAEVAQLLSHESWGDQKPCDVIETIQREIRKSLSSPPLLHNLSKQLNLAERTLRRRINEAGLSYFGMVDSLRRDRALLLLKHQKMRLIDVASETGFSDARSFRRAFKRWTGLSPREARKNIQAFPNGMHNTEC
ncbi:helix-turn-helix domain-containing protein [Pseudomonas sp. PGPR40]|uniref:helix-turn-helix domain-containing protein n=1 Tax=Pseudomonas sp. PGPR40 TaxID=2913476 RepID=UPI001ED9E945|nr:AraC family transcriptional regulator [Pseudomonas sp. PGPR40]